MPSGWLRTAFRRCWLCGYQKLSNAICSRLVLAFKNIFQTGLTHIIYAIRLALSNEGTRAMTRATKKELNEVLKPLFKAYDRYALGFLTVFKVAKPDAIEWRGLTIDMEISRRRRVVCNVPMPFSVYEFSYNVKIEGKKVICVNGRPSFIDAVFSYCKRNNINL